MLSWEELERQRQMGMLNPVAPLSQEATMGIGAPVAARPYAQLQGGRNGRGPMQFADFRRIRKERGNMGIAQPGQPEAATGDMPNSMLRSLRGLFN